MPTTRKDADTTLVVLVSFVGRIGNEERYFGAGQHVRVTDPAVKKWPHMFGPMQYPHDVVEQATAAPGEKRGA